MANTVTKDAISTRSSNRGAILIVVASVGLFAPAYLLQLSGLHQYPEWRASFQIGLSHVLIWMLMVLALASHHLRSNGESWRDLGLRFQLWVVPAGVVGAVVWYVLWLLSALALSRYIEFEETARTSRMIFATVSQYPFVIGVLYMIVAPCYEELIWRAFLITRLERVGWHWSIGVFASTGLELIMHLYQGFEMALLTVPSFLGASLFFVFYRNVYVLIIAHLLINAISALGQGR